MRRVAVLALLLLVHGLAVAGGAGSTGSNGLKLPAGARPTAMGGAFVGLADDLNSLTWNPAGLANVSAMEFTMMHSSYLADAYYDILAGALPLPWLGTAAASLNMLNYGALPHTLEGAGGLFGGLNGSGSASDIFFTVGWGAALPPVLGLDRLKAGANAKLTFQQLTGSTLAGVGISGGALWDSPVPGLRVGTMIDNLGGVGGAGMMPLSWVAGASYARDFNRDFKGLAALDTRVSVDVGFTANLGLELAAFDMLTVRAGWRGGGALGGLSKLRHRRRHAAQLAERRDGHPLATRDGGRYQRRHRRRGHRQDRRGTRQIVGRSHRPPRTHRTDDLAAVLDGRCGLDP